jgi:4-amino-4-deoxy-L-arabinose transferase-like glycosyltransferase
MLFLWQTTLSLKLFGFNALAVTSPSIILQAIASLLIFRIGKISNSEKTGYYVALFFTVANYPLELIAGRYSTDHNEISFLFILLLVFGHGLNISILKINTI